MFSESPQIKTYLEMLRDGILAFWDGDPETTIETATSTFVFVDTDEDVPEDAPVLPWGGEIPPEQARQLSDILGAYAREKGWEWMQIGDAE